MCLNKFGEISNLGFDDVYGKWKIEMEMESIRKLLQQLCYISLNQDNEEELISNKAIKLNEDLAFFFGNEQYFILNIKISRKSNAP